MPTVETIMLACKQWINAELHITCIFANQATPQPSKLPYASILLGSEQMLGGADEQVQKIDDNGDAPIHGQRLRTIHVQILGPNANALAAQLRLSLGKSTTQQAFAGLHDLAIVRTSPVINLTGLLETEYEERAAFDITIAYTLTAEDYVGIIERVEINDELIEVQPT